MAVLGKNVNLYFLSGGTYYPIACAKEASITITQDTLELAPKTNHRYKKFIANRISGSITGSGITQFTSTFNIISLSTLQLAGTNVLTKFEMTENGVTKTYAVDCIIEEINFSASSTGFANDTFKLLINGNITLT